MLSLLAALAVGYLLGGTPTAVLAARVRGLDIFTVGSGNMGALNTARSVGWPLGVIVALIDVGKGALAAYLGLQMAHVAGLTEAAALLPAMAAGVGAVLGHAFSPWVQFAGGKAIATTFGISLPLFPIVGLYYLALILALYLLARNITLAGLLGALSLPLVALLLLPRHGWQGQPLFLVVTGLVPVALIGAGKHAAAWAQARRARNAPPAD